jgi:hypothetical protein
MDPGEFLTPSRGCRELCLGPAEGARLPCIGILVLPNALIGASALVRRLRSPLQKGIGGMRRGVILPEWSYLFLACRLMDAPTASRPVPNSSKIVGSGIGPEFTLRRSGDDLFDLHGDGPAAPRCILPQGAVGKGIVCGSCVDTRA